MHALTGAGGRASRSASGERWRTWVLLAPVLGVALLTHGGALDNGFHYDDVHSLVDNPHIRSLADPAVFLDPASFSARPERAMFRPLVVASYAVQRALGAREASAYLVLNVALHLVCVSLVFALAVALGALSPAAALAALLFAVHPVNAEVVNYVSSRSESLAAVGVLGALVAYLRWRRSAAAAWGGALAAAAGVGLLSKATAVVVPAMLAAYEALHPAGRRWARLLPVTLLTGLYFLAVSDLATVAVRTPVRPLAVQWWTQVKAAPYYTYLLAMPVRLTVEHAFGVAPTPASAVVVLAALLGISVVAVAWRRLGPTSAALALWAAAALAPASLVPLNVLVNEHRLYLPGACLVVLGAIAFGGAPRGAAPAALRAPPWRRPLVAGALAVAVVWAILAHGRSRVWDSESSLWTEAVARAPAAYRAHLHLGGALQAAGDAAAALQHFRDAARLAPQVPETHYNLGNALLARGDSAAALAAWWRSLELSPGFLDARLNLAALYQDRFAWDEARQLLEGALATEPRAAARVWRRRGVLERAAGDTAAARAALARALALDPGRAETHRNLGDLAVDAGDLAAAARHYGAARALDPDDVDAVYRLAYVRLWQGDPPAAEDLCRQALGRAGALRGAVPLSKLWLPLAQSLEAQGQVPAALDGYRRFLRSGAAQGVVADSVRARVRRLQTLQEARPSR